VQALKIIGLLVLACVLAILALVLLKVAPRINPMPQQIVATFEECAAAGNPVMESYPRQCRSADGRLFVEEIANAATSTSVTAQGCAVAGCSGQLCVSADEAATIVTTCEYRAEYGCYRGALCEPQADGKCGWTQTAELKQCLANPPKDEMQLEVM
jgi:eight-cysteine-cluster-containing protein